MWFIVAQWIELSHGSTGVCSFMVKEKGINVLTPAFNRQHLHASHHKWLWSIHPPSLSPRQYMVIRELSEKRIVVIICYCIPVTTSCTPSYHAWKPSPRLWSFPLVLKVISAWSLDKRTVKCPLCPHIKVAVPLSPFEMLSQSFDLRDKKMQN